MNEIFNPSLLISLGPSGSKALDFSKKLLAYMPKHFLDLVDYYNAESLESLSKEIQEIVDTRLLSAKYLNRLVDLGYKVRSENISSVKINIYLLWDVYNSDISAFEVLKMLSSLNYGNIDKEQHSGVSLYVLPLMEKEWTLEEKSSIESIEKLKQIVEYVSKKENILNIDSKVYVLHCVSNDGTRIPMKELEYISGILTYLNILPSKEPPLSNFNRRLLMNEGDYKVGTIGITTLTVFKDTLLEDFSRYMAEDILKYAVESEVHGEFSGNKVFQLINYEVHKNKLKQNINIVEEEDCCRLSNIEQFELNLPKDISEYPKVFKNWEEFIEHQCLTDMKKTIDKNAHSSAEEIIENIEEDLSNITLNYSLKEAVNYLNTLEKHILKQKPANKASISTDTSKLNKELKQRVENYPNLIGYIGKCIILAAFFLYSMINILYPRFDIEVNIVISIVFFLIFFAAAYLEYWFTLKRINTFIKAYKEEVYIKSGSLINLYIEKSLLDNQKGLINYITSKREELISCIKKCRELSMLMSPVKLEEEENMGNLISDLLNFEDRSNFYKEKVPRISDLYRNFLLELGGFKEFNKGNLEDKIKKFCLEASPIYIELDFFEYMKFKYKENISEELSKWIDKGLVKSKYLLQYINNDLLEEHSLFITSPQVYKVTREMKPDDLSGFDVSIIEGRDIYTNCISIIRLCLGVNFNNIAPVRKLLRESERNA
ncbi:hypothetical protein JK636_17140 [Clostridium sp. YIM B02515]|uniref:Uncharacterized protein n=1 Tax=Clostridium rhizosphaerae TaxID=2803861 RepID=A0ABS1TDL0_9CLOT|nr:hypothetical protein [Clostridium rhizosphaerae]MBL4937449.1 hypothetical protein [Clostridium rhizosphaerae]